MVARSLWLRCTSLCLLLLFFFFNDTATPEIYPLSLHDALPIWLHVAAEVDSEGVLRHREKRRVESARLPGARQRRLDRKSTRLNSSHSQISYAVFCLKKKTNSFSTS